MNLRVAPFEVAIPARTLALNCYNTIAAYAGCNLVINEEICDAKFTENTANECVCGGLIWV